MIKKYAEFRCDRCSRVIDIVNIDDALDKEGYILSIIFDGNSLNYVHLCDSCKKRIESLLEDMKPTKKSRTVKKLNKKG